METLAENWFFALVLLACIGIHFLGHGHGHGHGDGHGRENGHGSHSDNRHGESESSEPR